ncbi:hypothetical protein C499_04421 [Halogeometricum borinquense DSM 11551]|uniref:DUF4013 domain-containing protein n=1 Tax=Halogeometricum borinquense (strain ATCC 700274 / DSM 11551 / JCM 10706 / KCTC 4070 / PR3) TaxID=469382 RepID=E4NSI5_HALBP|nr:DUF4013 domain-containing protein [Halogeometricum borinquense]ADQ66974.1 hypothetical protein Hbor_13930 [Halogeometricum borinquense DSM 11551]ELY30055.1 hypothetical protein C499_04421 [Halogeometricum borinquense DSM 11551]
MLGDALSYPRNSSDWIPTILIGGVLSLLFVFIIPIFIIQGYMVRVLRGAAKGETAAPSFTNWGELIVDGLKLVIINFVYSLIVLIPMIALSIVLGIGNSLSAGAPGPEPGVTVGAAPALGIVGFLGILVIGLFSIVVSYFIPAAQANFAIEGSLGAAFDISTIVSGAMTSEYFVAWVLVLVVGSILSFIGGLLFIVIVGFFILFYTQVVTYYLFGRGFAEGLGKKRRDVAEPDY